MESKKNGSALEIKSMWRSSTLDGSNLFPSRHLGKYEVLPTIRANIAVQLSCRVVLSRNFLRMFTDAGFLFVYLWVSQSGVSLLMDRSASAQELLWQMPHGPDLFQ